MNKADHYRFLAFYVFVFSFCSQTQTKRTHEHWYTEIDIGPLNLDLKSNTLLL